MIMYSFRFEGSSFNSVDFSKKISKLMISSTKRVVFVTGGAFVFMMKYMK